MIVLAFAMPAMAAVTITATDEGNGVVRINYASDANVSAFALEVSFDNGATVNDVNNYHMGESVTGNKGYGIFLDKINGVKINPQGQIVDTGKPFADSKAPDAGGTGLGKSKVILEMGALYGDGNQPPLSGMLCKIYYNLYRYWWNDLTPPTTTMTIALNATRGGVVLEDAGVATTNLPITLAGLPNTKLYTCIGLNHKTPNYRLMGGNAHPYSVNSGARHKDYNDFVAVGEPGCWCEDNDPNANARQCFGDADGASQGGKLNYWVSTNDLNVMLAAWQKKYSLMAGQTYAGAFGPVPWICADFDHQFQGGKLAYRVSVFDLNILLSNWQIKGGPDPICP